MKVSAVLEVAHRLCLVNGDANVEDLTLDAIHLTQIQFQKGVSPKPAV